MEEASAAELNDQFNTEPNFIEKAEHQEKLFTEEPEIEKNDEEQVVMETTVRAEETIEQK